MMNQPQQHMAMAAGMGGPVQHLGPPNAGTPNNSAVNITPDNIIKKLNTAIYEYLLYTKKYDTARSLLNNMSIETIDSIKQSPNQRQTNGLDNGMDVDGNGIADRPDDLPAPNALSESGPFLQDWWCQFWEIWHGNRLAKGKQNTLQYIGTQRQTQKARNGLMGGNMDPNAIRNMSGLNGMMNSQMDIKKRAVMQNMTPQQIQHFQRNLANQNQGNQGNQMERQGSQMDINGPRSGSPNTGDAPSPKRPRVDGNMQQLNQGRPGQPGQMQNNQGNMPQNPNLTGPAGAAGAQSSPMSQAGVESNDMYPNRMMPQNGNAVAGGQAGAAGGGQSNGNHALQDYQMQLMLLEQQNKKRLLMARQEQDSMTHPAGVGAPNQGGMMDPSMAQMRNPMMLSNPNVPMMRGPSSHPMPNQMTPQQQMEIMSRTNPGMVANGGNWQGGGPQQPPNPMMLGQQPGQGGPPGPNMTPRQGNMAPPPAPQVPNTGGTQPSSPAQPPAPPTPNPSNKNKPANKKNDNKNTKAGANKKGGAGANETSDAPTPTPPPPATPNNAANFQQNKNANMANGQTNQAQQQNNGPNGPQPANAVQPPQPDMSVNQPFGAIDNNSEFNLDYTNGDSADLLDNFDFDMFLNANETEGLAFDGNFTFDNPLEADTGPM